MTTKTKFTAIEVHYMTWRTNTARRHHARKVCKTQAALDRLLAKLAEDGGEVLGTRNADGGEEVAS